MASNFVKFMRLYYKQFIIVLVPLFLMPIVLIDNYTVTRVLYIYTVMLVYWICEVMVWGVIGLIPVVAFPALSIMDSNSTSQCYFKELIAMFFGFMLLSISLDNSGLYRRIAIMLLKTVGASPRLLLPVIQAVTYLLTMIVPYTAVATMMIPFLQNVVFVLEECGIGTVFVDPRESDVSALKIGDPRYDDKKRPSKMTQGFFLGTGYACSIGSIASLAVSSTNSKYKSLHKALFIYDKTGLPLFNWMLICIPMSLIMLGCIILYCEIYFLGLFRRKSKDASDVATDDTKKEEAHKAMLQSMEDMGKMKLPEISMLTLLVVTIVLIFFRDPHIFPGWVQLSSKDARISAVPMFIILLCFSLPRELTVKNFFDPEKRPRKPSVPLITWKLIQSRMPWIVLFFMGGNFALTEAARGGGLAGVSYQLLSRFEKSSGAVITVVTTLWSTILSQMFMDNAAVAETVIPVLADLAQAAKVHPVSITFPSVVSLGMGVLMPVSTTAMAQLTYPINIKFFHTIKAGLIPVLIIYFITVGYTLALGGITWAHGGWGKYPKWASLT